MLIRAVNNGYEVIEVPLHYQPRRTGSSKARLFAFARSYLATLGRMWLLRNDGQSADYENRAFFSLNLIQRWWQRKRFAIIRSFLGELSNREDILDIGCGGSKIIQSLPHAVAFDFSLRKLRFLAHSNKNRVCGSAVSLPFATASFDVIIHSQVLQYLPRTAEILPSLHRILRPGGTLIIGTIDSSNSFSRIIYSLYRLLMPYAFTKTSSSYSLGELTEALTKNGFLIQAIRSILRSEIIIRAQRNDIQSPSTASTPLTTL